MPEKILVIEDDPGIRALCGKILTKVGFKVNTAADFKRGIDLLSRENWAVVIIDIQLTDGSGMDILKKCVKTHPGSVPVMLSGATSVKEAVTAIKIGAKDFITKPFNISKLRDSVTEAVSQNSS